MATKLEKDVTRETSVEYNDRNIVLTITASQEVSMKLKGMKSGDVSIPINDLYKQLVGDNGEDEVKPVASGSVSIENEEDEPVKKGKYAKHMISVHDLRSQNIISDLPLELKVKFESIIVNVINQYK